MATIHNQPVVPRPTAQTVERPRENNQTSSKGSSSGGSSSAANGQTGIQQNLRQLEQNGQQQQGNQGQGQGGQPGSEKTSPHQLAAQANAQARVLQQQLQARVTPQITNPTVTHQGVNVFYKTPKRTKDAEKGYKSGGKFSSLQGKQLKLAGDAPDEWEDQIENNLNDARHQTRGWCFDFASRTG
jgi:hypothetical protein